MTSDEYESLIVGIRKMPVLDSFGITINTNKALRKMNQRVNHGRAKKVSVKRPSPRMSRERIKALKVQAIINEVVDRSEVLK